MFFRSSSEFSWLFFCNTIDRPTLVWCPTSDLAFSAAAARTWRARQGGQLVLPNVWSILATIFDLRFWQPESVYPALCFGFHHLLRNLESCTDLAGESTSPKVEWAICCAGERNNGLHETALWWWCRLSGRGLPGPTRVAPTLPRLLS